MIEKNAPHISVMLDEVIDNLSIKDGGTYMDCTFGAGGYSRQILKEAKCNLYGIDQDPGVIGFVKQLGEEYSSRFTFINQNFSNLDEIAKLHDIKEVDGIVFDLGVSSMQIDQAERGFSFNKDARLDMRMSQSGLDAWEVVNKYSEENLADIIYYYGEENFSRRIAKNIVNARKTAPIDTTLELAAIIKSSIKKTGKIDPSTKTFQAIRIYVNDELKVLRNALIKAYNLLKIDGRLVIVSFQGLEDRIIKDFINQTPSIKAKIFKPSLEEVRKNPRSRSAKLRTIIRRDSAQLKELVRSPNV